MSICVMLTHVYEMLTHVYVMLAHVCVMLTHVYLCDAGPCLSMRC